MKVRPLESQFGELTVERIRIVQHRVVAIQEHRIVPRYVTVEIAQCLEAGLLFAALHLTCSVWEIAVRHAVVGARAAAASPPRERAELRQISELLNEAEDDRNLGFARMLKELVAAGTLTQEEADAMQENYRAVRIPLHHGLLSQYVRQRTDTWLLEMMGRNPGVDNHTVEEQFEANSLNELEKVLAHMELLVERRAV